MRPSKILCFAAWVGGTSACVPESPDPQQDDPLWVGVWRQRGYARVLEIGTDSVTAYDVTSASCVTSESLTFPELMTIHEGIELDEEVFSWVERGKFTRYAFDRIAALPEPCLEPPDTGPIASFEALWHLFAENYAYFDLRGVDWPQTYAVHAPRVGAQTSSEELLEVFSDMLVPLSDGHVYVFDGVSQGFLSGSFGKLWEQWAAEYEGEPVKNPADPRGVFVEEMRAYVLDEVLQSQGSRDLYDAMHWGWLDEGIGYLDVHTMAPAVDEEIEGEEVLARVDLAMDRVLAGLAGAEVLVIDARFNQGGDDAIGFAIAGRFVDAPVLVSRKYAVFGETTTDPQEVWIQPRGETRFRGPVVLLQGPNTISAAETFTLAMHQLPQVDSVGEATYGAFSDVLLRVLPNGWLVALSNETYEAPDGQVYEGRGIPADIEVELDEAADFEARLQATLWAGLDHARALRP